jgi:hypothetical protein
MSVLQFGTGSERAPDAGEDLACSNPIVWLDGRVDGNCLFDALAQMWIPITYGDDNFDMVVATSRMLRHMCSRMLRMQIPLMTVGTSDTTLVLYTDRLEWTTSNLLAFSLPEELEYMGVVFGNGTATVPLSVYSDVLSQDGYFAHDNVITMFSRFTGIPITIRLDGTPHDFDHTVHASSTTHRPFYAQSAAGKGPFTICSQGWQAGGSHYRLHKHANALPDFPAFFASFLAATPDALLD